LYITSALIAAHRGRTEKGAGWARYPLVDDHAGEGINGTVSIDLVHSVGPVLGSATTASASVVLEGQLELNGTALSGGTVILGLRSTGAEWHAVETARVLTVHSNEAVEDVAADEVAGSEIDGFTVFDVDDIEDSPAHNPSLGFFDMKARMLVDGSPDGARSFTLGLGTFAPQTGAHGLHRHAHAEEFFYLWEGVGVHLTEDGGRHNIWPGNLVHVPRNEWHGFENTGPTPARALFGYLGVNSRAGAGYEVM
jgi:quercetin dioxygenase-like cupin family protein